MGNVLRFNNEDEQSFDISERLMMQVGERVKSVRKAKGISRRELAEVSGVSQRYLAQLEAGAGNISISLLARIAQSLGQKIEWFVEAENPKDSQVKQVAEHFSAADHRVQKVVLEALNLSSQSADKANRVCLIGLRGAGKSTLGKLAADHLGIQFLELNKAISQRAGMPIDEILALYGQEGYRNLEASSLERVIESEDQILLAVAGGIVSEPATFDRLLSSFHTIWIKADPQEHMDRVRAQGDERLASDDEGAMQQLKNILQLREEHYAKADTLLDTSQMTLEQSLNDLLELFESQKYFDDD